MDPARSHAMSDAVAVELQHVSKTYAGGIKAVDGICLQVPAGRIVALLGPSGCGKTTTLRLINRLEEATGGCVLVRGQDVRSQRPEVLRRSIGYVIQDGGLFPHQAVAANVATVPRLLGWDRKRVRDRVAQALELVGLPEAQFGRRLPAELSGGQRQRVGVARALAADPDLLLMDEPFGALDPGTRESIYDEFLQLNARLRKTVVLVTHDIIEAGRLADEIVLLDHGHIAQAGTLRDLLLRPADERVRRFLGGRGPDLALSVLRLRDIVGDLPAQAAPVPTLRLQAALPLGRALVALAGAVDSATVAVDGEPGGTCSAAALEQRILADLETVAAAHAGVGEDR
jgi:osmoprotectant transport system ATP-binding protein